MKVLYIGYYCEKSDWGVYARNNILALEKAGIDVVCRAIKFSGTQCPEELRHLEEKDHRDCNIVIQHVFPEHLTGSRKFNKNIAIFSQCVDDIKYSSWQEKLSVVDEIWLQGPTTITLSEDDIRSDFMSVNEIHPAIDTELFNLQVQSLALPALQNKFICYTIGDITCLNEIEQVIRCFHSTFSSTDDAILMVLMYEHPETNLNQKLEELSTRVKGLLKIKSDPAEFNKDVSVVVKRFSPELMSVHSSAHQYISCNKNMDSPLEEYYAAGFGSNPIVADDSVAARQELGWIASSVKKCILSERGGMFDDVYNGRNYSLTMCDASIQSGLITAYSDWKENPVTFEINRLRKGREILQKHSLKNVGKTMKGLLDGSL